MCALNPVFCLACASAFILSSVLKGIDDIAIMEEIYQNRCKINVEQSPIATYHYKAYIGPSENGVSNWISYE